MSDCKHNWSSFAYCTKCHSEHHGEEIELDAKRIADLEQKLAKVEELVKAGVEADVFDSFLYDIADVLGVSHEWPYRRREGVSHE